MSDRTVALYVHVPFCRSKCLYCDFASYPNRESDWQRYFDCVRKELISWAEKLKDARVVTVFIGGGTPSLVPAEQITSLLETVRTHFSLASDAEITMEANPGTVTVETLRAYRSAGINRLSFGAQSFDDRLLRAIGRIHDSSDITDAVTAAREAGFSNINLDLMYGLPGQTVKDWADTLGEAIRLEVSHLSAYSLIVEEGTPLYERVSSGRLSVPDDDTVCDMQTEALARLRAAGFHRYEISNYARPGHECRHNIVYWERGEYLGVGCAAHSLINGERFENPRSFEGYLNGERMLSRTALSKEEERFETIMLGTRMCRGIDLNAYRSEYGRDFVMEHSETVKKLSEKGLVRVDDGRFMLTDDGLAVQNAILIMLTEEEERL